jgi:hypothetical protein
VKPTRVTNVRAAIALDASQSVWPIASVDGIICIINGASFDSVKDLIGHIDAFIAAYNQTAKPFLWTKSKVHKNASDRVSPTNDSGD